MHYAIKYVARYVFRMLVRKGVKWALAALPALLLACNDYPDCDGADTGSGPCIPPGAELQHTDGPEGTVATFATVYNGHVYTVYLGQDGAPVAVGTDHPGKGWWTATVDYVYSTGGSCTDGAE